MREAEDATRRARLSYANSGLVEIKAGKGFSLAVKEHAISVTEEVLAVNEENIAHIETLKIQEVFNEKEKVKVEATEVHNVAATELKTAKETKVICEKEVVTAQEDLAGSKQEEIKKMSQLRTARDNVEQSQREKLRCQKEVADLEEQLRLARLALKDSEETLVAAMTEETVKDAEHKAAEEKVVEKEQILVAKNTALSGARKIVNQKAEVEQFKAKELAVATQEVVVTQKEVSKKEQVEAVKHRRAEDSKGRTSQRVNNETAAELRWDDAKLTTWRDERWVKVREAEEKATKAWQKAGFEREKAEVEHVKAAEWEDKASQAKLLAEFERTRPDNFEKIASSQSDYDTKSTKAKEFRTKQHEYHDEANRYADIARGFQKVAQEEREKVEASINNEQARLVAQTAARAAAAERATKEAREREKAARMRIAKEEQQLRQTREQAEAVATAAERAAKAVEAKKEERIKALHSVFAEWDKDGTHTLDVMEFFEMTKFVDPTTTMANATKMFFAMDATGSGMLEENEFINFLNNTMSGYSDREFEDSVSKMLIHGKVKHKRLTSRRERIRELFAKWDINRDRQIQFEEFCLVIDVWNKHKGDSSLGKEELRIKFGNAAVTHGVALTEEEFILFLKVWMSETDDAAFDKAMAELSEATEVARLGVAEEMPPEGKGDFDAAEEARRVQAIAGLYDKFDVNHDKNIDMEEFMQLGRIFEGNDFTPEVAQEVYATMDQNADGKVSADEFLKFVAQKTKNLTPPMFDDVMAQMLGRLAEQKKEEEEKKLAAAAAAAAAAASDHGDGMSVVDSMVANIKSLAGAPLTYRSINEELRATKYDDFINWFMNKSSKTKGYNESSLVDDAALLVAVTSYLGLSRGADTKRDEEASLKKKSPSKAGGSPAKAESSDAEKEKKSERAKKVRKVLTAFGEGWEGTVSEEEFHVFGKALEGEMWSSSRGSDIFNLIDKDKMGFIAESDFVAYVRDGKQFLSLDEDAFDGIAARLEAAIKSFVEENAAAKAAAAAVSAEEAAKELAARDEEFKKAGANYVDYENEAGPSEDALQAEVDAANESLAAKKQAVAALDSMSEEEIVAQSLGMTVEEYKEQFGV